MNRIQKLKMNAIFSLLSKFVILMSGLLLPRLILSNYGSEMNGLVNSITQFLSIITFLDLGVGSVVQSTLYKPLAQNNTEHIAQILKASKKYFRHISYLLIIYIAILIFVYPLLINIQATSYISTILLIIAISVSQFGQYYFGIVNELLLNADQKAYIQYTTEIIVVILNLIISTLLITLGYPLYIVKFASGLIYLIRPIFLNYYVKRNYNFPVASPSDFDPIPQKWNGVSQHLAYSVQNSTDIVVLTIFSTLYNISIYSVYNMIASAIRLIVESLTTGIQSFYGGLLAENKMDELKSYFAKIEWGLHTLVVLLYGMTATLITPFILLYTKGINDVNYNAPIFALILVIGKGLYSLRTPYQAMIFAASHYQRTQLSSIIEAAINVFLSLILVYYFDLIGVVIGSLFAITYRLIYMAYYLSKNIIYRPLKEFIKQFIVDSICFSNIWIFGTFITNYFVIETILNWIIIAIVIGVFSITFSVIINVIFYKSIVISLLKKLQFKNS